jgi:hypothetical protein
MINADSIVSESNNYVFEEMTSNKLSEIVKKYAPDASKAGHQMLKFYFSLIMPQKADDGPNALPLFLYRCFNAEILKFQRYVTIDENGVASIKIPGEPNDAEPLKVIAVAPPWYKDLVEKMANIELANQYILWVLKQYNESSKDSMACRQWWQEHFPWAMEERRKLYYILQKTQNVEFRLLNEGPQDGSDFFFIWALYNRRLEVPGLKGETLFEMLQEFLHTPEIDPSGKHPLFAGNAAEMKKISDKWPQENGAPAYPGTPYAPSMFASTNRSNFERTAFPPKSFL